jgi:hypothetical protein
MPGWWNGRHEGLKILWLYGCAGSSPASGTFTEKQDAHNQTIVGVFVCLGCTKGVLFNQTTTKKAFQPSRIYKLKVRFRT